MKIAVWHNLPSGGGKRALYNHIKALKEQGHYIESWTTDTASQDYLPLSEIITEHCKPIKEQLQKIEKIQNPIIRTIKINKLLKTHLTDCTNEIHKGGFDLIFANSCKITYMPFIGLYSQIPVFVYLGEPNRSLYEATETANIWELPAFKFSLRGLNRMRKDLFKTYARRIQLREEIKAAKSCSKILVNSLYSRESIKKAYGINSNVCYLGIDEKLFHINYPISKKPFIVGLGRISKAKNVEMAIRVISKIQSAVRPQLKWISNGSDPYYLNEMCTLATDLEVNFSPLIDLSDEKLKEVLSEASVMLYTSHLEPFGLAPIEANMCGTYVIAIAEGGVRESIVEQANGTLIKKNFIEGMAKEIYPFINDLNYAQSMGEKARKHALNYWNWKTMAENIENELQFELSK